MSKRGNRYARRSLDMIDFSKTHNLSKIEEDPKEVDDEDFHSFKKIPTNVFTPKSRSSLPPIGTSQNSRFDFLLEFLVKLTETPQIYKSLTESGQRRKILTKPRVSSSVPVKLSQLFIKPDVSPVVTEVSLNTSLIQEEIVPVRPLTIEIKPPESDKKRQNSKESIVSTPIIVQKPAPVKLPVLDKQNSKLFEQFRSIVGSTDMSHKDYKLNYDSFKEFLNLRYPAEMTEVMLRWLYHGLSVNFEGWVQDMQKFINFSQEKHARVAFELFDFNRDRYICTADAFHIISLNNSIIFDQDIVRIRQAFIQKTQNELNSARMSARKKKNTKNKAFTSAEDENKFKVPSIHPSKPEALTLEDFLKVQFPLSKPQIIIDIIKYLTGFDLVEFNQESIKQIKRKRSEEIVEEMILSPELREKAANDPRIFYYRDLENAMTSFSLPNAKSLLNKFNEMNIDGPSKLKEINYKSIIDYFPRYFGSDNPYILRSFHNLLSGPKNLNITKVSYLSALSLLFSVFSTQDETSNFFAFSIYDQNQDGQITCEEINRFFETLNEKTLMYKECLILINEFIASIFGKRHKQLDGIDFQMFKDLIPKSILIEEFSKSLLLPEGLPRKNLAFCDKEDLTTADLDSLKRFTHLSRNIELGELSRKNEEDVSQQLSPC